MKLRNNLIFVRHGESTGNVMSDEERVNSDIPNHRFPLTPKGRKQAAIVGKYLKKFRIKRAYQSTFYRAGETMSIILEEAGLNIIPFTDSRLDERWDGIFHEMTIKEIEEKYPDEVKFRKKNSVYHHRAIGGENYPDVEVRAASFVNEKLVLLLGESKSISDILEEEEYDLIVGHGRWFQIFRKYFHGLSMRDFKLLQKNDKNYNCGVTVFDRERNIILEPYAPWEGLLEEVSSVTANFA